MFECFTKFKNCSQSTSSHCLYEYKKILLWSEAINFYLTSKCVCVIEMTKCLLYLLFVPKGKENHLITTPFDDLNLSWTRTKSAQNILVSVSGNTKCLSEIKLEIWCQNMYVWCVHICEIQGDSWLTCITWGDLSGYCGKKNCLIFNGWRVSIFCVPIETKFEAYRNKL